VGRSERIDLNATHCYAETCRAPRPAFGATLRWWVMRLERAVLATIDGDARYEIEADVLRLDGPNGRGLRLRAVATK